MMPHAAATPLVQMSLRDDMYQIIKRHESWHWDLQLYVSTSTGNHDWQSQLIAAQLCHCRHLTSAGRSSALQPCVGSPYLLFGTHSIASRAILANTMALPSRFLPVIQYFPFLQLHYPGSRGLNTVPGSAQEKCLWWETRSCFSDSGTRRQAAAPA